MRWIRSHKVITSIIAVLVLTAGIFAFSAFHGGGSVPGVNGVVESGQEKGTEGSEGIKGVFKGIFRFSSLTEENEALRKENERLRQELSEAELSKEELAELKEMADKLNYDLAGEKEIVTASISSFDGTTWINKLNIAKGTEEGIDVNDVAVNGNGLAGRVEEAGKGWARIVSIVDDENRTSFKVKGRKKVLGILYGDGKGGLEGYTFESSADIRPGDELMTSGMGLYPAGLSIGKVTEAKYSEDTQLNMIKAETTVDFRSLTKVSVIK